MEEVIKYFEQLESRLAAAEERNAALENRLAAMDTRIDELKSEREQLLSRLAELENAQQEVKPKLAAIAGHLNRMNEILEDAQMRSLEPEEEEEPEPEQEPKFEPEQVVEPEIQSSGDPEIQEPEPESEPVVEPEPEPAPIAETPVVPKEEQVSPKAALYGKAVDDIRLAISLGDRFLYQRELFGQNAEKMQRTLDELNRLGSFDEAIAYINSHFQWDTESNTYQQFLVTLHRRFG